MDSILTFISSIVPIMSSLILKELKPNRDELNLIDEYYTIFFNRTKWNDLSLTVSIFNVLLIFIVSIIKALSYLLKDLAKGICLTIFKYYHWCILIIISFLSIYFIYKLYKKEIKFDYFIIYIALSIIAFCIAYHLLKDTNTTSSKNSNILIYYIFLLIISYLQYYLLKIIKYKQKTIDLRNLDKFITLILSNGEKVSFNIEYMEFSRNNLLIKKPLDNLPTTQKEIETIIIDSESIIQILYTKNEQ